MGKGGQIWLKCITVDLNMMIRDKNNIFETDENFHAEMAWNYPSLLISLLLVVQPAQLLLGGRYERRWCYVRGRGDATFRDFLRRVARKLGHCGRHTAPSCCTSPSMIIRHFRDSPRCPQMPIPLRIPTCLERSMLVTGCTTPKFYAF